eukprot:TRINITY_DN42043_c0_g1_i1.p1 TRINITY_DN42043_c0_g1~~TRINITY_DN42043_c0_g1_i1.p1  ORF type:complete len:431 (-),score=30.22 TRINITY_DN42043_c0_g1_i1:1201-2493(-)
MQLACCGASRPRHPLVVAVPSTPPNADSHVKKLLRYLSIVDKFRHPSLLRTEAYNEIRKVTLIWAFLMVFSFSALAVGMRVGNCAEGCPSWMLAVFAIMLIAIGVWQRQRPQAQRDPLHILLGLATLYDFYTDAQSVVQAYHCDAQYQQSFLVTVRESKAAFLAPVVESCHLWGLLLVSLLMASALQAAVVCCYFSEVRRLALIGVGPPNAGLAQVSRSLCHSAFFMAEFLGFGGMANYFWSGCAPDRGDVASVLSQMEDECLSIEDERDCLSKAELGNALHMAVTLYQPTSEREVMHFSGKQNFLEKAATVNKWYKVVQAAEDVAKAESRNRIELFLLKAYAVLLVETIPQFYLQTSLFAFTFSLTSSTAKGKQFLSFTLSVFSLLKDVYVTYKHVREFAVPMFRQWSEGRCWSHLGCGCLVEIVLICV